MTAEDHTLQTEEGIASDRLQDSNVEYFTQAKASGSRSSSCSHPTSLPNMTETAPPLFSPSKGVGVEVISQNRNINDSHIEKTSAVPQSPRAETNKKSQSLALEDLLTPGYSPKNDVEDKQVPESLHSSVDSSLASTDPNDSSFRTDQDLRESTSKLFTWNYLDGRGRLDSCVDNAWVVNGIEAGRDLMGFRDRVVRENGGLTGPYEKLGGRVQTGGLQGQVEDETWENICNVVKDTVPPLSDEAVAEAHRWAHLLAQNSSGAFLQLLDDSPPQNRILRTILTKTADTAQLWNTQMRNEDLSTLLLLNSSIPGSWDDRGKKGSSPTRTCSEYGAA
ncbi:hypothetical protein BGX27_003225 [Mortierella sp. AM989]|nr:hypothetical protein BGX27_003225 [Mortierella sp. AM989]